MIYNEEESIASVVESIRTCDLSPEYERVVVAVNDGSTDKSQDELDRAARVMPVHTIFFATRQGIPISFAATFDYLREHLADDDVVFTMEADATNDIACVPHMMQALEQGADVVIASRYAPGAKSLGFPWYRLWGSYLINLFLRLLWAVPGAKDYSVLYRAYRGSLLKKYVVDPHPFRARKSFAVIAEILLQVSKYTSKITEVPLLYDYSLKKGKSKMKLMQTLWEYTRITPLSTLVRRPIFWAPIFVVALLVWLLVS